MTRHLFVAFSGGKGFAGVVVKDRPGGPIVHQARTPIEPQYEDWQALLTAIMVARDLGATELTLVGHCPALQEVQLTRQHCRPEIELYHFEAWRLLIQHFNGRWRTLPIPPMANPAIKVAEGETELCR